MKPKKEMPPSRMLVWPATEATKKLKHPTGAVLRDSPDGTLWPADQFTFRRVIAGDLLDHAPEKKVDEPVVVTIDPSKYTLKADATVLPAEKKSQRRKAKDEDA